MTALTARPFAFDTTGTGVIHLGAGLRLRLRAPRIDHADGRVCLCASDGCDVTFHADTDVWTWMYAGQYAIEIRLTRLDTCWLALHACVINMSTAPMYIEHVVPLCVDSIESEVTFDRVFTQGRDMCGFSTLEQLDGERESDCVVGFGAAHDRTALVIGFGDFSHSFGQMYVRDEGPSMSCEARWQREGIALAPETRLTCAPLLIGHGQGLDTMLRAYAHKVGQAMHARTRGQTMTGWCSWYYYYGTETQQDILDDLAVLAASPLARHLRVIQIDDGWNKPTAEHPRVWGDWQAGTKFPQGMRHIAQQIKAHGFQAGLWLAPFSVDTASRLYHEHPDWLVQGTISNTGLVEPADCFGVAALDLTHPAAHNFLRETFTRVFDEWGFDYVKIDFLLHALTRGRRYDNTKTTAEVYRLGLALIREIAGDRFILTCGAPLGPSIGLTDAMRIGMDVSSRWYLPFNLGGWPLGNCAILPGARQTALRQWMHRAWWQNDPDCILVRDTASPGELHEFANINAGEFLDQPPYGLSEEEAGFWLRLTWLTGGMALLGECVQHLSQERMNLLERAFPPIEAPARRLDWQADSHILAFWSEAAGGLLGIFNFSDEPHDPILPAIHLGNIGQLNVREWISGETLQLEGTLLHFPTLPGRAGRIWRRVQE